MACPWRSIVQRFTIRGVIEGPRPRNTLVNLLPVKRLFLNYSGKPPALKWLSRSNCISWDDPRSLVLLRRAKAGQLSSGARVVSSSRFTGSAGSILTEKEDRLFSTKEAFNV